MFVLEYCCCLHVMWLQIKQWLSCQKPVFQVRSIILPVCYPHIFHQMSVAQIIAQVSFSQMLVTWLVCHPNVCLPLWTLYCVSYRVLGKNTRPKSSPIERKSDISETHLLRRPNSSSSKVAPLNVCSRYLLLRILQLSKTYAGSFMIL